MNNKKAKHLRRAVALTCAGQNLHTKKLINKLVKTHADIFDRRDSITVTAMKIIALVKHKNNEADRAKQKKALSQIAKAEKKASEARKKLAEAMKGIPNVQIT